MEHSRLNNYVQKHFYFGIIQDVQRFMDERNSRVHFFLNNIILDYIFDLKM